MRLNHKDKFSSLWIRRMEVSSFSIVIDFERGDSEEMFFFVETRKLLTMIKMTDMSIF